ncbi:MAG TPA: ribbon-helix-helix protein, CopG family [Vicinamibacteria bacterium]|nr:ribbon-helix-helix protein, CopG family [Vicinamibacteria bacterium]
MAKTVTLRLDDEVYEELREAAEAENRPLSNLIETAALARIREQQFVDDAEMAEIRGNERLLERLKVGSKQARRRKGRFVE